jgi:hypothetical protein
MKKIILLFTFGLLLILVSCGKAAESKDTMHSRAKEVQDSIANSIKSAIAEVETLTGVSAAVDTTKKGQ